MKAVAAEVRPLVTVEAVVQQTHKAIFEGNRNSWLVADGYLELSRLGWTQQQIADEFKSSQPEVSRFLACAELYSLGNTRPRFWGAYQEVRTDKNPRTLGTGQDEWYTPPEYLELVRVALGGIDLDPASCETAQANVKAASYFTEADDGLSLDWHGRVFMNPPYSQPKIELFVQKLTYSYNKGDVSAAVTLTTNNTDTDWFQHLARQSNAICFTDGRVNFIAPDGRKPSPNQGHVFCYMGEDVPAFEAAFRNVGVVLWPR